jgi:hypothetical protein
MAEIGVVKFARVALRVGQVVLPAYRRKFFRRQVFPPPASRHSVPDAR